MGEFCAFTKIGTRKADLRTGRSDMRISATACAVRNGLEVLEKKDQKKSCQVLTALFAFSLYGESFVRRDSRLVSFFVNLCQGDELSQKIMSALLPNFFRTLRMKVESCNWHCLRKVFNSLLMRCDSVSSITNSSHSVQKHT